MANLTASRVSYEKTRKLRFFQPHDYISVDYATQTGIMVSLRMGRVIERKLEPAGRGAAEAGTGILRRVVFKAGRRQWFRERTDSVPWSWQSGLTKRLPGGLSEGFRWQLVRWANPAFLIGYLTYNK